VAQAENLGAMASRPSDDASRPGRRRLRTVPRPASEAAHSLDGVGDDARSDPTGRWQSIEIRHLAALAAVAREGSFSRAADRLDYVQSAISGQIAHLEQVVGIRLLERASGTPIVELTRAGEVLLRHTDEILARFETAYADVTSLANRTTGAVRVAGLDQFSPQKIARIVALFRERHPFARLVLQDFAPEVSGLEEIASGKLDLLISESPCCDGTLTEIALDEDDYVLLAQAGSEIAVHGGSITAAESSSLHPIVPDQLRELGIESSASVTPESVATAQALASGGLGVAILPSRLVDRRDPDAVPLDLSHLFVPQTIVLVLDEEREHSSAVYGLVHALREVCGSETPYGTDGPEPGVAELATTERPKAA
jgi:DNA-binding transcriptional LysR family regulator